MSEDNDKKSDTTNLIQAILKKRNGKYTEELDLIEKALAEDESKAIELFFAFGRANPAFRDSIEGIEKDNRPTFRPYSLMNVLNWPPKEWLIKDLLGKGDIVMLFGEPGSGKSFIAIDLILTTVTGKSFAGHNIGRPLKAAYCAGEGLGDLQNRLAAAIGKHSVAPDSEAAQRLTIFDNIPQLFNNNTLSNTYNFVNEISANKPDLLIIDTFHTATLGMNENCTTDVGIAIEQTKYIQRGLDCTVILIHHTNKTGGYRGSSSLHGAMDTMLQVKSVENIGSIICFKQKSAKPFNPLAFRLKSDSVAKSAYVEWIGEPAIKMGNSDLILDLLEKGLPFNQSQIAKELECGRDTVRKILFTLAESGKINKKKQGCQWIYFLSSKNGRVSF